MSTSTSESWEPDRQSHLPTFVSRFFWSSEACQREMERACYFWLNALHKLSYWRHYEGEGNTPSVFQTSTSADWILFWIPWPHIAIHSLPPVSCWLQEWVLKENCWSLISSENTLLPRGRWILFPFPYLTTLILTKTLGKGTGKASLWLGGQHCHSLAMRNPLHQRQETQNCLCQSPGVPIHCSLMLPTGRERKSCLLCWAEGPGSGALKEIIVFIARGLLARVGGQVTDKLQKV